MGEWDAAALMLCLRRRLTMPIAVQSFDCEKSSAGCLAQPRLVAGYRLQLLVFCTKLCVSAATLTLCAIAVAGAIGVILAFRRTDPRLA
jgi:hypothetical protein